MTTLNSSQIDPRTLLNCPFAHDKKKIHPLLQAKCVLYCTMLYYAVLCCTMLYCAVLGCTGLYCAVLCCTVLYCAVLCCTVLYCVVLCCTVLFAVLGQPATPHKIQPIRSKLAGPACQPTQNSANQRKTCVRYQPIRMRLAMTIKGRKPITWLSSYLESEVYTCQSVPYSY